MCYHEDPDGLGPARGILLAMVLSLAAFALALVWYLYA